MAKFEKNLIRRNKLIFEQYTHQRRRYAYALNAEKAAVAFELIPALLSLNEAELPGFVSKGETGCGVYGVGSAGDLKNLIERYFPETKKVRIPYQKYLVKRPVIETLFVMGSVGTIAQTDKSDFDFWVCVDAATTDEASLGGLREKTDLISQWCDRTFDMEVHFFVSELDRVRDNDFGSVDEESTGSSQKRFLKEECYRTMLLVCGKIPLWWVLPPGVGQEDYETCRKELMEGPSYDFSDFVDLGFLGDISHEEFLGTALWHLSKGIKDPFKALLKMAMMEWYLSEDFEGKLLCDLLKERVQGGGKSPAELDPYLLMVNTILDFYERQGREDHMDLVRKAFYIKADPGITPQMLKKKGSNEKIEAFKEIIGSWKWPPDLIEEINRMAKWSYARRLKFSREINKFFFSTYRRLSEAELLKQKQAINDQDMTILARKIYVLFARQQKKLQLNPFLTTQKLILDRCVFQFTRERSGKSRWVLYDATRYPLEKSRKPLRIFSSERIVRVATWLVINGIYDYNSTAVDMPSNPSGVVLNNLTELLRRLQEFFGPTRLHVAEGEDLGKEARCVRIMAVVDMEVEKASNGSMSLDLIFSNTWGEIFTEAHSFQEGLAALKGYVGGLNTTNPAEAVSRIKVYAPKSKKEESDRRLIYQAVLQGLVE